LISLISFLPASQYLLYHSLIRFGTLLHAILILSLFQQLALPLHEELRGFPKEQRILRRSPSAFKTVVWNKHNRGCKMGKLTGRGTISCYHGDKYEVFCDVASCSLVNTN
jgi:hypothetical protein